MSLDTTEPRNPLAAPRPDSREFRHELTPTWISTASLLSGERPTDFGGSFRVAYLDGYGSVTSAVVAAVHPESEVFVWSWLPSVIETAIDLRSAAALDNLVVQESPGAPGTSAHRPADLIVLDGVIDAVNDERTRQILDFVRRTVRPGGSVVVTYRTIAGWTEIQPLYRLLRYIITTPGRDHSATALEALEVLGRLRAGGAAYIAGRPIVAAWLDELQSMSVPAIVRAYIDRDLRPSSHNAVVKQMSDFGAHFVGSTHLLDDLASELPEGTRPIVAEALSRTLRESYADLALRRSARADLFRVGSAPLSRAQMVRQLDALELVDLTSMSLATARGEAFDDLGAPSGLAPEDHGDIDATCAAIRRLMASRAAHPVSVTGGGGPSASVGALNTALAERGHEVRALMSVGSALDGAIVRITHKESG